MNSLTKIEGQEVVTDSRDLEDVFGIQHRSIYRLILKHKSKLGKVRFQIASNPSGQKQSYAILNEEQAILLLTYTRSNDKTDMFRKKLVSDFIKMREFIRRQETIRLAGIESRKSLTDAVKDSKENERMHGHAYSTYTNMVYEICGLKGEYKQFKSDQKIVSGYEKLNFRDTLSESQLNRVKIAESFIKPLLDLEKGYNEIKEIIKPLFKQNDRKESIC
jgi:phage regulator Rha-like protein